MALPVHLATSFCASALLASSAYLYFLLQRLSSSLLRISLCIPLFVLFHLLPFLFDTATNSIGVAMVVCIVTWLASFKVAMWCFGRGPLAHTSSGFLSFTLFLFLPIHVDSQEGMVKQRGSGRNLQSSERAFELQTRKEASKLQARKEASELQDNTKLRTSKEACDEANESWRKLILQSSFKILLLSLTITWLAPHNRAQLPPFAVSVVSLLNLYLFVSFVEEVFGTVAAALFGIRLLQHFNQPYLASSLSEFWARRWNLTVSACLRESVYEPVLDMTRSKSSCQSQLSCSTQPTRIDGKSKDDTRPASTTPLEGRLLAVLASFFVSGVMHELCVFYLVDEYLPGEMLLFFTLHGAAVLLEGAMKRSWPHLLPRSHLLRTAAVLTFNLITADMLFLAPLRRAGLDLRVTAELLETTSYLRQTFYR